MKEWIKQSGPILLVGKTFYKEMFGELLGERVVVITSPSVEKSEQFGKVLKFLSGIDVRLLNDTKPNPTTECIDTTYGGIQRFLPSTIIAIGGGSVIDVSKVLSARFSNPEVNSTSDLIKLQKFQPASIKLIAIPTTAGTGAEVTPFATLWHKSQSGKSSIESLELMPDVALLDCDWTKSASLEQSLYSGLDAVSHCVETLWNKFRNPISEMYAIAGLHRILSSLPNILEDQSTEVDFYNMQLGAMFGGQAIAQNHTAIAHSMSYPLTAHLGIPHGLACSFTIPAIWEMFKHQLSLSQESIALIIQTTDFILSLNLSEKLAKLRDVGIQSTLSSSITNNSRAENFLCNVSMSNASEIIQRSIANWN